ncbi:MAG: hypothetical protein Q4D66_02050 [Bacteroidales bacterium]|nr:hypothetical protein [Bacteroidales bacterium]
MKKHFFVLLLVCLFGAVLHTYAQSTTPSNRVGIGTRTPDANAILDISATDKGVLLPRVALTKTTEAAPLTQHVAGMFVYNTATANDVKPGIYYNDGTKWVSSSAGAERPKTWYWMPSITIDMKPPFNMNKTVDLYAEFKKQVEQTGTQSGNPNWLSSTGVAVPLFTVGAPEDYHYIVTEYDRDVMTVQSISSAGVMTYSVSTSPTEKSYINIAIVEK